MTDIEKKFGCAHPLMDVRCRVCGDCFGEHIGAICPKDFGGKSISAALYAAKPKQFNPKLLLTRS